MKIFLDIDGVMVHANPSKKLDFEKDGFYKFNVEAINALKFLVKPSNEVILSTSHRFRFDLDEWFKIFSTRGLNFKSLSIIDYDIDNNLSRKDLILYWIKEKGIVPEDFIIIDDDKSLNGLSDEYKNRLVLTNPYIGLKSDEEIKAKIK